MTNAGKETFPDQTGALGCQAPDRFASESNGGGNSHRQGSRVDSDRQEKHQVAYTFRNQKISSSQDPDGFRPERVRVKAVFFHGEAKQEQKDQDPDLVDLFKEAVRQRLSGKVAHVVRLGPVDMDRSDFRWKPGDRP